MDLSDIRMVIVSGQLHLASDNVVARFPERSRSELEALEVDGVERWVRAPIPWLIQQATAHLGEIHLAGKSVAI
jgi:hypothetical protein